MQTFWRQWCIRLAGLSPGYVQSPAALTEPSTILMSPPPPAVLALRPAWLLWLERMWTLWEYSTMSWSVSLSVMNSQCTTSLRSVSPTLLKSTWSWLWHLEHWSWTAIKWSCCVRPAMNKKNCWQFVASSCWFSKTLEPWYSTYCLSPDAGVSIWYSSGWRRALCNVYGHLQNAGESPSVYLLRLQVALNLAVKRGGW